jgi:hypothetical protein
MEGSGKDTPTCDVKTPNRPWQRKYAVASIVLFYFCHLAFSEVNVGKVCAADDELVVKQIHLQEGHQSDK